MVGRKSLKTGTNSPTYFRHRCSCLPDSYGESTPADVTAVTLSRLLPMLASWRTLGARQAARLPLRPMLATSAPNPDTPAPAIRRCPKRGQGSFMARQFIYHMQGLTKAYPGNRKILEN